MRCLYTLSVLLYGFSIRLASLFNAKARLWIRGRKGIFSILKQVFRESRNTAWFHCASLGEFEQGRTIIEAFRKQHPDYRILLTFFSPSGYEIRKNYEGADVILYLPLDTPWNVRKFLEITKPELVFFIKYEYWYNYIHQLYQKNIPIFIVSGIFRPSQHFFKWYGKWFRNHLREISCFFLQNQQSQQLLDTVDIRQALVTGDTRFDRVASIASKPKSFPFMEEFKKGHKIFLAGSTWPEDEAILFPWMQAANPGIRFIIAPHEVHQERINGIIEKSGVNALRFSELIQIPKPSVKLIVIDSIGQLSSLYQYADVAFIGGGFGKGIHNILEAATFGLPVIIGPNYHKFQEARELIEKKGVFSIQSADDLEKTALDLLMDEPKLSVTGNICSKYVKDNTGATISIMHYLDSTIFKV